MARELQARLDHEADAKGLEGERRREYIGGAWNRIRGADQRAHWRHSEEGGLLGRFFGPIHDMRQRTRGAVAFRQGAKWYDVPRDEYERLIRAAREETTREGRTAQQIEREDKRERERIDREIHKARTERERAQRDARTARERHERAQARAEATRRRSEAREAERAKQKREREEARAIALYLREFATEKKHEARERAKRERQEAAHKAQQERQARRMEREQYSEIVAIIRHSGGIRPFKRDTGGRGYLTSEYRALPSTVRSASGRLDMDTAARNIQAQMPWLQLETPRDLADFFTRRTERGYTLQRRAS